jgi:lipid A ethanolaminephosphotransferase
MSNISLSPPMRVSASKSFAFYRPTLSVESLILLATLFFTLTSNNLFWRKALAVSPHDLLFACALFTLLFSTHALLFGLLIWRWNAKIILSLLFIATAFATHYMNSYHVYLDADMLRNVLATDQKESRELLTSSLLFPLFWHALIPCVLLWSLRLKCLDWKRTLTRRMFFIAATLLALVAGLFISPQHVSSLLRNHREIRYLTTPANYLVALKQNFALPQTIKKQPKQPIGLDAKMTAGSSSSKPRLLVVVVGETVRAQNWGLNGYSRNTTPELAQAGVINFPQVQACGTSTEVSLPCMFSPWGRRDYNEKKIRGHESLLHVLEHAGISTLWRDNQSGCKGVCDGLAVDQLDDAKVSNFCTHNRCMDEILLHDIAAKIRQKPGDRVVVLHQLGNHGPSYFERYPASFRVFTPTCNSAELGQCTQQGIVNSYDNAIRYTDHFLAQAIAQLDALDDYDSAMIYVSDHGESLGEKGLYLHGIPYVIAPEEQIHVPMVMWFSPGFAARRGLDIACLKQRAQQPAQHDHLFSSILGLMQVNTSIYTSDYDLFAQCSNTPLM